MNELSDFSGTAISEIFGAAHQLENHPIKVHDAFDGSAASCLPCLIANESWIEVTVHPTVTLTLTSLCPHGAFKRN